MTGNGAEDSELETYEWVEFWCSKGEHWWRLEGPIEFGIGDCWRRDCYDHDGVMEPLED